LFLQDVEKKQREGEKWQGKVIRKKGQIKEKK
jgi:hypothetical protein